MSKIKGLEIKQVIGIIFFFLSGDFKFNERLFILASERDVKKAKKNIKYKSKKFET